MLVCLEMQIISFVDGGSVWVIVKKFAPDEHSFPYGILLLLRK